MLFHCLANKGGFSKWQWKKFTHFACLLSRHFCGSSFFPLEKSLQYCAAFTWSHCFVLLFHLLWQIAFSCCNDTSDTSYMDTFTSYFILCLQKNFASSGLGNKNINDTMRKKDQRLEVLITRRFGSKLLTDVGKAECCHHKGHDELIYWRNKIRCCGDGKILLCQRWLSLGSSDYWK